MAAINGNFTEYFNQAVSVITFEHQAGKALNKSRNECLYRYGTSKAIKLLCGLIVLKISYYGVNPL